MDRAFLALLFVEPNLIYSVKVHETNVWRGRIVDANRVNPLPCDIRVFLVLSNRILDTCWRVQFTARGEISHPTDNHPIQSPLQFRDEIFFAEFWIGVCRGDRGRVWHIMRRQSPKSVPRMRGL